MGQLKAQFPWLAGDQHGESGTVPCGGRKFALSVTELPLNLKIENNRVILLSNLKENIPGIISL
jgi:hypothetical protein